MWLSRKFKSSAHCLPSPDGQLVATLLPSEIHIRAVDTLGEVAHVVPLPSNMQHASVFSFQWSLSSQRLLVATPDQILVCSADDSASTAGQPFQAVIRNPVTPAVGKPAFIGFGPEDDQICLCSALGLKFSVFNLRTAQTTEVANPKLYSPAAVCSRGFSFRSGSHHLALLTRTAGKDWVSVHSPASTVPVASWSPSTIDAQGLIWAPNGCWLVVWESAAHGHKILFYTPDGHLFKTWTGAGLGQTTMRHTSEEDTSAPLTIPNSLLGSGVRLAQFSPDSRLLAVADVTRCIHVIDMASILETRRLLHPTTLDPHTQPSVKVWQEQLGPGTAIGSPGTSHTFIEATQAVLPPDRPSPANPETAVLSSGCSLLAFDGSAGLLATRLEEAPSTVWIWDVSPTTKAAELHTVLMFHANVSSAGWHPTAPHNLLVACEGARYQALAFVWEPLTGPPRAVSFLGHFLPSSAGSVPVGQEAGKLRPIWLNSTYSGMPLTLFYSDGSEFALAALAKTGKDEDNGRPTLPWLSDLTDAPASVNPVGSAGGRGRAESPLELVPAEIVSEGDSELEDTFHGKRGG